VKESLFGLLRGHVEGATVFDGFSGTGAIGLECASRGAARVICVERDRDIAQMLRANVELVGATDRVEVVCGDALGPGALARAPRPLTLAFLDPPYPLMEDPIQFRRVMAQLSALVNLLTPDGFAVLRTPWPLLHSDAPAPAASAEPVRRKRPKEDWRREVREALDGEPRRTKKRDKPEPDEAAPQPPAAPPVPTHEVDLHLPNAKGPESHVYRQMAVHLYMKA